MEFKRIFGPLSELPFARYFIAVLISQAGTYASAVALSFGVLAASSPSALGFIFLARQIPVLTLLLAGGVFADRWQRRFVLAGASFLQGTSQLVAAVVLIQGSPNMLVLAGCAAVNGAANAFESPATTGMVPQVISPARLQQANALLGLTPRIVGIAGAALGAWLVNSIGAGYALAFDSMTFVLAGTLLFTVAPDARRIKRQTSPLADLREGWFQVRSRTWLWTMILSGAVFQFAYFPALTVLGPEIALRHLGGATGWASIITGELVGGIIGGLFAFKIRFRRPLLFYTFTAVPVVVQLFGFAMGWPLFALVVCAMFSGIGFGLGGTIWYTTLQRLIPAESLSRVSSFDWLGSLALNPIGFAVVGPLSMLIGERMTMGFAAALLAVATFLPLTVPAVVGLRLPAVDLKLAQKKTQT